MGSANRERWEMVRSRLFMLLLLASVMSILLVSLAGCGGETTTTTAATTATTAGPVTTAGSEPATTTSAVSAEPIKIGMMLDLTGFLAWTGTDNQKGMELALEQADYKAAGRTIEFIVEDAASDAATTMDKFRKLVDTDKVNILAGPVGGAGGAAIAPAIEEAKIPKVELAPSEEVTIAQREWTFAPHGTGNMYGFAVADYVYNDLGYKTAVGMASDFEAGHQFLGGFVTAFKALGGQVLDEIYYPPNTTDFLPFFASLKKADCFVPWWPGADGLSGFPQYKESGLTMPIVQPEDGGLTASRDALHQIGEPAVGCLAGTLYTYLMDTPGNPEFVAAYEAKYGAKPGVFAGAGYATMQYILAVLESTNGDATPEVLQKAMKEIRLDTVCGPVYFPNEENNIAVGSIAMLKVSEALEPEVVKVIQVNEKHDAQWAPILSLVK
jgi:branched-chain amino acid transport system substrate-binding protein